MNILAVDTAGKTAAVAVLRDDVLLYEAQCNNGLTHSETLLPMIDTALKAAGLTVDDLDVLGVTNGPGSFTGLRIGLAVVKGLALPRQILCAGVSTMAALAYGLAGEGTVIGAQDARRGQVYWGAFDLAAHDRLTPDTAAPVTTLENFVQTCKKPLFFVGDGATLCYNTYKNVPGVVCVPQPMQVLRGAGVALAARAMWERGECVPPAALLPDYHRLSQAERERAEREKQRGNKMKFDKPIALAADHGGYELKEAIKAHLDELGVAYTDFGTDSTASVDYPDFAAKGCKAVQDGSCALVILCCGTGVGMSMCANKMKGIRACCCSDTFSAEFTRRHNNANALCLGGRVVGAGLGCQIVDAFLNAEFEGGRHQMRIDKMMALENH